MANNIISPTGTLSYPHIDQPQPPQKPGDKAKYSAMLILAPGTDITALLAAELAAAELKFGTKIKVGNTEISTKQALEGGVLKRAVRTDVLAKGLPPGSAFLNARSERKPGCVYSYATPGTTTPAPVPADKIREVLYPGAQVKLALSCFGYARPDSRGVTWGLEAVQFVADGDRIDGRQSAEHLFTADLTQAPADLSAYLS